MKYIKNPVLEKAVKQAKRNRHFLGKPVINKSIQDIILKHKRRSKK